METIIVDFVDGYNHYWVSQSSQGMDRNELT